MSWMSWSTLTKRVLCLWRSTYIFLNFVVHASPRKPPTCASMVWIPCSMLFMTDCNCALLCINSGRVSSFWGNCSLPGIMYGCRRRCGA
ncbi:hypothetical protein DFH29DRAFT_964944 [Suillus ampliporus]|nr:hypothetical protein DFH29DRAFT_964944 [Suillus ampliporus]